MDNADKPDLGRAISHLIESASRDEQGLQALVSLRDALSAIIEARAAEERAIDAANEAVVPIDPVALASMIDRAAELVSASDEDRVDATSVSTSSHEENLRESEPSYSDPAAVRSERDAMLPGLAERARMKADLAHACATSAGSGVPVEESLIHRARSTGATTWMADLTDAAPHDLLVMADCFAALSETAEYLSLLRQDGEVGRERFPYAVRSMAAVVSALRVATLRFRQTPDEDQLAGFDWLRDTTASERIFVDRHMRLDDPYDPEEISSIVDDIHEELEALREVGAKRDRRRKALSRLRYHAGLIAGDRSTERDRDKVVDAVEELVADGLAPSSLELRDLLLPIRAELPEPVSEDCGYCRVLREVDQHLARAEAQPEDVPIEEAPSPQVKEVAELLSGSELVIIGGESRPEAEEALVEAFGLSGLTWLHLADNPTSEDFSGAIARDTVSVVVLLVRWARHRYGDAKEVADLHGKPFVRAPGGYNKNALAAAIMDQASRRLAQ